MQPNFNIDTISTYLITASIICLIILLFGYCRRIYSLHRNQKKQISARQNSQDSTVGPVSVIVYCRDNAQQLKQHLPGILNQNYPAPFEVIIINDGEDEETNDIIKQFSLTHKNLHTTFTPKDARNVSRKKLSLTLGIKSAKYDILVFTNANAQINSAEWLSSITTPLHNGKDITIAIATPDTSIDRKKGKHRRAFDSALDATKYLTSAIHNRAYKADSFNLAYKKHLFFNNKGFSHSLNLQYGDEDLFISEIATPDNTATVLLPESIVTKQIPDFPAIHKELKQRHLFTSKLVKKYNRTKYTFGLYSLTFWSWLALSTATIIHNPTSIINIGSTILSASILWVFTITAWNKTFQSLNIGHPSLYLPYLIMTQPIYNFIYRIKANKTKSRNYTWN